MLKLNVSGLAQLRQISSVQLFKRGGQALKEELKEEFKRMLIETPQWSGSTVASYRIGPGRMTPDEYVQFSKPKNASEAFKRGHMSAVNEAMRENEAGFAAMDDLRVFKTQDIVIKNASPQWDVTEHGPLREVNEPTGTFAAFVETMNNKIIEVDLGDL